MKRHFKEIRILRRQFSEAGVGEPVLNINGIRTAKAESRYQKKLIKNGN